MSETERRYVQIEKEALATTWACEKFTGFIMRKRFLIETEQAPCPTVKYQTARLYASTVDYDLPDMTI